MSARPTAPTRPYARGTLYAVLAAIAFGLTMPVVERAGRELGPFSIAALLYGGAVIAALVRARRARAHEALPWRPVLGRIALVALVGGALAPTLLAAGTARTGATSAALLLHLEAPLTLGLAVLFLREPLSRHASIGSLALVAGGVTVVLGRATSGTADLVGALLVVAATLAWAVDNALSRGLAEHPPFGVVLRKAALGASLTALIAVLLAEPSPPLGLAAAVLVAGATGYGVSLALFLQAQRLIGAGRTSALFGLGPFVGAAASFAIEGTWPGPFIVPAVLLFALGLWLHAHEPHQHAHAHAAEHHSHWHRHDDGHHDHVHAVLALDSRGGHLHDHPHAALWHDHPHAPDLHHRHPHPPPPRDD